MILVLTSLLLLQGKQVELKGKPNQAPQDAEPVEIKPAQDPAVPQDPGKKTCDGKCHQPGIEPMMAKFCEECKKGTAPCMHGKYCEACAKAKKACAWCGKPMAGSSADIAGRLQGGLDKALAGHRAGRSFTKKLLPRVTFAMVVHDGTPCKSCAKHAEALVVVEYKDEKDTEGEVRVITSEKDLSELLKRQKLEGKEEAALCVAELVQALYESKKGDIEPSKAKDVKIQDGKATFTIKKGDESRKVTVTLNDKGAYTGLE